MLNKKHLWTLVSVVVLLGLIAAQCAAPQATPAPAPATEEAAPPAAAPVTVEDEWGVVTVKKGDPVKIGFAAGISGAGIDVLGIDEQRGAEIANADKGEVKGFPVELQVEDSQCNAEGGQTVATKFVADPEIVAVVGHMCSSSCTPAADIYSQNHYSMVSPSCTAPSLTAPGTGIDIFNRTAWNDTIQGPAAADFVYDVLGVRKVATIHDGSPYAEQLAAVFSEAFEGLGGEIVAAEAVNVGDTDMRPVLTRINANGPELLYFSAFPAEGAFIRTQMPDVDMEDVLMMGADGIQAQSFIDGAGDAAEGVYSSAASFADAGPGLGDFLATYKDTYGEDPIAPFHAHAYDAYMIIVDAIDRVGVVNEDGDLLVGRKALLDAIRSTTGYQGLTGTLACDENGDCGAGVVSVSMVENGAWVSAVAGEAMAADLGAVIIGMNAEYPPFESVDDAGNLVGFDIDLMNAVAQAAGFEFEYVNTRWDGIFVALASGEFDAVISAATITPERAETVDFSDPYFEAGQALAVRADTTDIAGPDDLAGRKVGVQLGTTGDIWLTENTQAEVVRYDENTLAFQALGSGEVDAAMADNPTVAEIVRANPELNLKVLPGVYTEENYGIAVNKDRADLLAAINQGLAAVKASGEYDAIYDEWFGVPEAAEAMAGEDVLVIGTTDKVTVLDPADSYDFHTWEIHHNTMDTLLHYVPGTTDLEPGLAAEMPEVSDDGLEYTFKLKEGLSFPDGEPFNAEAVKWSIDRVFRLEGDPNWLVTSFVDRVEVVDEYTVKFVLLSPVNYFPLLVATQPYSPVSPECYSADAIDADSMCGGVGPYMITKWERDVEMVLEAYDGYPNPPATPKIIVKYYADSTTLRLAAESGEVDVATKTLNPTDYADLEAAGKLQVIEGPGAQIRYICFNVTTPPFDDAQVRQAISYAVDRDAVTTIAFQGTHAPLYSMVPMGMWSHIDAFPERDLDMAKELLTAAGYSEDNKLVMDLWWTPTHYGPTEADVATVLKDNLEETGMVEVSLQNTEWATYKEYMNAGSMPVFLLGWYPDYLDPDNYTWSWGHSDAADDMGIFYANDEMDALLESGQTAATLRGDDRLKIYEDAQNLWVEDPPTVPLTQGALLVVAQPNVTGIVLDPNMLFHYFLLAK